MLHEKAILSLQNLDTKRLKRKPSFGKFGANFQRQPFTDVFQNKCS